MLNSNQLVLLAEKQAKLDNYIQNSKNLTNLEELQSKKIIAFIIEVAEFLNEYRDFKFWSNKKPSEKSILLEEYIDGIHFILSIGLSLEYEFKDYEQKEIKIKDLSKLSIQIFKQASTLDLQYNKQQYENVLDLYLSVAKILGFTDTDILQAYELKNKENFNRQDNGY